MLDAIPFVLTRFGTKLSKLEHASKFNEYGSLDSNLETLLQGFCKCQKVAAVELTEPQVTLNKSFGIKGNLHVWHLGPVGTVRGRSEIAARLTRFG